MSVQNNKKKWGKHTPPIVLKKRVWILSGSRARLWLHGQPIKPCQQNIWEWHICQLIAQKSPTKLGTRLTDGRDEISTSAMIVLFFRLNSNGKSVEVHFGQCTRPCHWLKRFHLVIRWGKICFFVILRCSQTICFSGWSRHWKSWYFFRRSTRHDIICWGEHGKIVWRHMNCWIIECKPWLILWWPFLFSYVFNFWGSHSLSVRHEVLEGKITT